MKKITKCFLFVFLVGGFSKQSIAKHCLLDTVKEMNTQNIISFVVAPQTTCATCETMDFSFPNSICINSEITFVNTSPAISCFGNPSFMWDFGDGSISSSNKHIFNNPGTYKIKLYIPGIGSCREQSVSKTITVSPCQRLLCKDCIGSFAPDAGDYIISAWVKEENAKPSTLTYINPEIFVSFLDASGIAILPQLGPFKVQGKIIDGWQKIDASFTIHSTDEYINIELKSIDGNCFFDDIRVFPKNGSMKSYVYDPVSLRLVAELDENNYAAIYEYDEEGKLIRVKKESEEGIITIKENKNSINKK